jgi:VanZ family protein
MSKAVVRAACRLVAWGIICTIALASLMPATHLVRSPAGGQAEHVAAYTASALSMAVAYRSTSFGLIAARLAAFAASLEYLQRFSPGRRSSVADFAFSGIGIVLGGLLSVVGNGLAKRWHARLREKIESPRKVVPWLRRTGQT